MTQLENGQCGLCSHFDEHSHNLSQQDLVKIRKAHEAGDDLVAECGHPSNQKLHLKVTPSSGCEGFEPAEENKH